MARGLHYVGHRNEGDASQLWYFPEYGGAGYMVLGVKKLKVNYSLNCAYIGEQTVTPESIDGMNAQAQGEFNRLLREGEE